MLGKPKLIVPREGDFVILKPMRVLTVHGSAVDLLELQLPGSYNVRAKSSDIAEIIKQEFKLQDKVHYVENPSNIGIIKGISDNCALLWIHWEHTKTYTTVHRNEITLIESAS